MANEKRISPPRYSQETWAAIQPAVEQLNPRILELARKVLVEGHRIGELAKAEGYSRQTVHTAVKGVLDIVAEPLEQGLVPVLVWVFEEEVPALNSLAAEYGPATGGQP